MFTYLCLFVTFYRFLEPALLKFHVENAILIRGRARNVSEEDAKKREEQIETFVQSYKQAQKVHQIRLELEATGHPDHQRKEPYDLGQSIELLSLDRQKQLLEDALRLWLVNLKRFTTDVPALLFLRDKFLLRAIQNIRSHEPNLLRMMPFVILCLGAQMLHFRDQVYGVASSALQRLVASRRPTAGRAHGHFVCSAEEGLSQFAQLIQDIQQELEGNGHIVRHEADDIEAPKVFVNKMISRDAAVSSVEKTYEAMILQYVSNSGSLVCPLSTQIVWGNKATSIIEVKAWLQLARAPVNEEGMCVVHSLYFVAVDQLSIPCRQVLLEGLLCQNEWHERAITVPVSLFFSSNKGLESFVQFPDSPSSVAKLDFQSYLWSFREPNPPVSRMIVVAGDSGSGKSHWCCAKGRNLGIAPECWLHIVVHEGFCVQLLIDIYRAATDEDQPPNRIGIHFDVSEYCDLELFGIVMHDLLATGLFLDASSGDAQVLLPNVQHFIFVELPALEEKWPRANDETFHASQHPFLSHLPAVKFASTMVSCQTLSCKQNDKHHLNYPLFDDCKTSYVAQCLQVLASKQSNEVMKFPRFQELPFENLDPELPPKEQRKQTDSCICHALAGFGVRQTKFISKRIICNFVSLLFERCLYLSQMQEHTSNFEPVRSYLYDEACSRTFLAHFWVHPAAEIVALAQPAAAPAVAAPAVAAAPAQQASAFKLQRTPLPAPYPYIPDFYSKILRYCVDESAFLAGAHLPQDEPQVWVLRPSQDYNKVRLLVSLPKKGIALMMSDAVKESLRLGDFMQKRIVIEMFSTAGKVEAQKREDVAAYFNLSDGSRFKQVVEQSEYVLTTEFLFKLFLLQGRRSCRSSLVFSGVRLISIMNSCPFKP